MYRIAVLVIHGIGEQREKETLEKFTEALVGKAFSSKPDRMLQSYDQRILKHFPDESQPTKPQIDFVEYYWAQRFRDTRYSHIIDWVQRLMKASLRKPYPVPPRLKWIVRWVWLGGVFVGLFIFGLFAWLLRNVVAWFLFGGSIESVGAPVIIITAILFKRFRSGRNFCNLFGDLFLSCSITQQGITLNQF